MELPKINWNNWNWNASLIDNSPKQLNTNKIQNSKANNSNDVHAEKRYKIG